MKPQVDVIQGLTALAQTLSTTFQQLTVHRNICAQWGYTKLTRRIRRQSHLVSVSLDDVLQRLLGLGQAVDLQNLGQLNIGQTVEEILVSDRDMASLTLQSIERLVVLPGLSLGTRLMMERVAAREEERLIALEQQLELARQMGSASYLSVRC